MPGQVKLRLNRATSLLAAMAAGALTYMFMPSCSILADADDTLCHAIAAAKDGVVDWPVNESDYWYGPRECHGFDTIMECPWRPSEDARRYIEGFGIAQGHNWDDLGRADIMTFQKDTMQVDTPLGRTYNGYSNLVFSSLEGVELDRTRSLGDFEYYDSYLKWASAYTRQNTYRINGNCFRNCQTVDSKLCVIARTSSGAFRNDYIDLYQTFFYDIDAIWRASTIVHEVRHARNGVVHDGGSGCPAKSACDKRWSSAGANTYELIWLAAYYWTPSDHPFITPARRARAGSLFSVKQQVMFNEQVQWRLGSFLFVNEIPEFYAEQVACSEDPSHPHHCLILAQSR